MKTFFLFPLLAVILNLPLATAKTKATPASKEIESSASVKKSNIKFKAGDGSTEFTAIGRPAMMKIIGEGSGPEGQLTYSNGVLSGQLKVDLQKLTTKIETRDEHMKDKYLEVAKYPTAELMIKELKLQSAPETFSDKDVEIPFTADFTLHGQTKPVSGIAKLRRIEKSIQGEAEFSVKIMEFLDTLPSYAGIKVAEDVKVKVKLNGQIE